MLSPKSEKQHVDIRAYNLVRTVLEGMRHGDPTAASTALRRLRGPAERAEKKAARPAPTKTKDEWNKAHERAEHALSIYIRTRDTRPYADGKRRGACCTCGTLREFGELQAGHWISRKHWGTKFHEINLGIQDWHCNSKMHGNGRPVEFERYIVLRWGEEWPHKLQFLQKTKPKQQSISELNAITEELKTKTAAILQREANAV
jgi:Bacteriophage Lambda NinG protein